MALLLGDCRFFVGVIHQPLLAQLGSTTSTTSLYKKSVFLDNQFP
jgi:hypothetical protein